MTVQPYISQGADEVSFEKGVTVEVIQKNLEGWWYIRLVNQNCAVDLTTIPHTKHACNNSEEERLHLNRKEAPAEPELGSV